jgi:spore coat polysaccharide biosynthesis protein SpsF (cytidylyltransferase family)
MKKVIIGIQARSTSTRLPNKAHFRLGERRILDHVIDSAKSARNYLNKYEYKNGFNVDVVLLVPDGDAIENDFSRACEVATGSEADVLSRYVDIAKQKEADYICRITGDCPLLPSFIITRMIKIAMDIGVDYISNVDEGVRTSLDGADCEVMSVKALNWLDENATDPVSREHVTLRLRAQPPSWLDAGVIIDWFDLSGIKLSIDTQDDLDRVRGQYDSAAEKYSRAKRIFGKQRVFRA